MSEQLDLFFPLTQTYSHRDLLAGMGLQWGQAMWFSDLYKHCTQDLHMLKGDNLVVETSNGPFTYELTDVTLKRLKDE